MRVVGTGDERCPADVRITLDIIDLALVHDILRDKAFQVLHTLRGERVKFVQVDNQARRHLQQMGRVVGINHAVAIIILKFRREKVAYEGALPFSLCAVE